MKNCLYPPFNSRTKQYLEIFWQRLHLHGCHFGIFLIENAKMTLLLLRRCRTGAQDKLRSKRPAELRIPDYSCEFFLKMSCPRVFWLLLRALTQNQSTHQQNNQSTQYERHPRHHRP
jgi:hypothetical protein